jgi:hypothetical protein
VPAGGKHRHRGPEDHLEELLLQRKKVYLNLYKQYVRPHLEFSVTAWAPWLEGDKETLEKVQEKAKNARYIRAGFEHI